MNSCLQQTFCMVGAAGHDPAGLRRPGGGQSALTMAGGVHAAVKTFKEVLKVVKDRQPLQQMRKLVASYDLGTATQDMGLCEAAFSCKKQPTSLQLRPIGKVNMNFMYKLGLIQ